MDASSDKGELVFTPASVVSESFSGVDNPSYRYVYVLVESGNGYPTVVKYDIENKTSDNEYKAGDKVSHKVFGDGVVVSTTTSTITVAFKVPYGIKTLFANHPAIRKI